MKKFLFILIFIIGALLNAICNTYVFHFNPILYGGLFGFGWTVILMWAYKSES